MQAKLRRNLDTLTILGKAVVAFIVWSVIKFIINYIFEPFQDLPEASKELSDSEEKALLIIFFIVLLVMILDIAVRVWIGLAAVREGSEKKKGAVYIVLASLLALTYFYVIPIDVINIANTESSIFSSVAALIIDTTSFVTLTMTAVTAIKVKRLRKKLAEQKES